METIPQLNTWQGLFSLVTLLLFLYWLLKLIAYLVMQFAHRNLHNKKLLKIIEKSLLIFKPLAVILVLMDLIAINYITHTIIIVIVGVFAYSQIRNYIHGVFLKINPLIVNGATIQIENNKGEIKKLLPLGMIFSTENGEQFINYITLETKGFIIRSDDSSLLRQTLYVQTDMSSDDILDLLFDNPILNYNESPSLKTSTNDFFKLQYTLETGVSTNEFINFLESKNIKTSLTNNEIH